MRILVVGRGFPSKKNNMLGSFEYEQAQMLAKDGHEVYYPFIDLRSVRHWRKFGMVKGKRDGVNVIGLNIPIGRALPAFVRNKLYAPLLRWQLKTIGRKYGIPDIVNVHYPSFFRYDTFIPLQERGVKVVGTEHWTQVQNKTLDPQCLKNLNDFVKNADAVSCVGASLRKSIIELTGTEKEIKIIPNVVNAAFKPVKEEHNDGFRFLASGRLVPVKQFDKIIEAFLNVFQGAADVSLTIAGDGEEYNNLVEIIKRRDAENQVHLLGVVSRQRMTGLIAQSDALVVFSRLETFCVPIIEAWTCGKPVIATTTTVFADNPDKRLGIMVDWEDIKSLENALLYIYNHYSDYAPDWINKYAIKHFSEEVVCKQLVRIYTDAMK